MEQAIRSAGSVVGPSVSSIPAEGPTIGGKAFPSIVAFTNEGDLLVGEPARRQLILNPEQTVTAASAKWGPTLNFIYLTKITYRSRFPRLFYKR